jgi:hypothetical protein
MFPIKALLNKYKWYLVAYAVGFSVGAVLL